MRANFSPLSRTPMTIEIRFCAETLIFLLGLLKSCLTSSWEAIAAHQTYLYAHRDSKRKRKIDGNTEN